MSEKAFEDTAEFRAIQRTIKQSAGHPLTLLEQWGHMADIMKTAGASFEDVSTATGHMTDALFDLKSNFRFPGGDFIG